MGRRTVYSRKSTVSAGSGCLVVDHSVIGPSPIRGALRLARLSLDGTGPPPIIFYWGAAFQKPAGPLFIGDGQPLDGSQAVQPTGRRRTVASLAVVACRNKGCEWQSRSLVPMDWSDTATVSDP
jgi:hypothetical protein